MWLINIRKIIALSRVEENEIRNVPFFFHKAFFLNYTPYKHSLPFCEKKKVIMGDNHTSVNILTSVEYRTKTTIATHKNSGQQDIDYA